MEVVSHHRHLLRVEVTQTEVEKVLLMLFEMALQFLKTTSKEIQKGLGAYLMHQLHVLLPKKNLKVLLTLTLQIMRTASEIRME